MHPRAWRRRPSVENDHSAAAQHQRYEAKFRALVQHSSDLITVVDEDLIVRYQSPSLERVLGYSAAELIGTSVVDLVHPDEVGRVVEEWGEMLSAGVKGTPGEWRVRRSDGTYLEVETINNDLTKDPDVCGYVLTTRDISERKRADREREEWLALLGATLDAIPGGILAVDEVGTVLTYNRNLLEICGVDEELLGPGKGADLLEAFVDQVADPAAFSTLAEQFERDVDGETCDVVALKDGRVLELRSRPQRLRGEVVGRVWGVGDVTERHRGEDVMRRSRDEAERANRAKSEFLSRMSHELRTPLNAILGFTELLELDATTEDQRDATMQIERAGRHLLGLIDDVLDIGRIDSGRLVVSCTHLDLAGLLAESVDLMQGEAAAARVTLHLDEPSCRRRSVVADGQRLRQVVLNLVSNAIKYNRSGGLVGVSCHETPTGQVRIVVADTGRGIAVDRLHRLYLPFDRLDADDTAIEGSGIGLALTKHLIEAMGGTIGVESTAGEGSRFWIELSESSVPLGPGHEATRSW